MNEKIRRGPLAAGTIAHAFARGVKISQTGDRGKQDAEGSCCQTQEPAGLLRHLQQPVPGRNIDNSPEIFNI